MVRRQHRGVCRFILPSSRDPLGIFLPWLLATFGECQVLAQTVA
jgi:hypothetical protein